MKHTNERTEFMHDESCGKMGTHIMLNLFGCNPDDISHVENVESLMKDISDKAGFNRCGEKFHQFQPKGVTGVIVLSESHMSIHSWPENGSAAIDIFTCGNPENAKKAASLILENLDHERHVMRIIHR